jgi:hypothetical protein
LPVGRAFGEPHEIEIKRAAKANGIDASRRYQPSQSQSGKFRRASGPQAVNGNRPSQDTLFSPPIRPGTDLTPLKSG